MFDFSRDHLILLTGSFLLVALIIACVVIFSKGRTSLTGKWIVREYRVENRVIKREEAELRGGESLSRWNNAAFIFTPEGHVVAQLPGQEGGQEMLSYQFDGHYIEITDPGRKNRYRLLELVGEYLAFSPPYGNGLVILLEKE